MNDSHPPRPKRRWYQFSLRTLLIVMTVFAIWIGLTSDRANRQRRAVEAITEAGAQFCYDYQAEPKAAGTGFQYNPQVDPPGPEWLRQLAGEHYFITPVCLSVEDQRVIDEDRLACLDDLPDLEEVLLMGVKVGDSDLAHLTHLTKLRELCFGTLSDDDGPLHFDFLSTCRRLEKLSAPHSQFGNADLAHLKRARNLRCLLLNETSVGDDGLAHLARLSSLDLLELSGTEVTDAGLVHLRSLRSLTYLGLNETKVTDAGLEHLKGLTGLTNLGLSRTRTTKEGVKGLRSTLPKCRIEHYDD